MTNEGLLSTKQRIKDILCDSNRLYRLLFRKDDVYIHTQPKDSVTNSPSSLNANIPGCIFLLERTESGNQHRSSQPDIYFLWVPYLLLVQFDNGKWVKHTKTSGKVVTSADFQHLFSLPTTPNQQQQQQPNRSQRSSSNSTPDAYVSATLSGDKKPTTPFKSQIVVRDEQYSMALKLQEVSTIKKHIPTAGYPFIIINQSQTQKECTDHVNNGEEGFEEISHNDVIASSVSYPPLYFHDGGISDFLRTLQSRCVIAALPHDQNLFKVLADVPRTHVNSQNKQLEHSLNRMHFEGYFDASDQPAMTKKVSSSPSTKPSGLLEWGAKLSKQARDILSSGNQSKMKVPANLPQVGNTHISLNNFHFKIDDDTGKETKLYTDVNSNIDFDYIPNSKESELSPDLDSISDEEPTFDDFEFVEQPEQESKPEPAKSHIVDTDITFAEIASVLHPKYDDMPKLNRSKWDTLFDSEGTVQPNAPELYKEICCQIYYGGMDEDDLLRAEVWKYLLGYYSVDDPRYKTRDQREKIDQERSAIYEATKQQWTSITPQQELRFALFRERKGRIEKDVVRTDRSVDIYTDHESEYLTKLRAILITYGMWNFDLGYCQGMGDLLSPILHVIRDEAQSFWCFVCLMESPLSLEAYTEFTESDIYKMEDHRREGASSDNIQHWHLSGHFEVNSKYMEKQLQKLCHIVQVLDSDWYQYLEKRDANNFFMCFRWILVLFKREFSFHQIKNVWERLWSLGFNQRNPEQKPCSMNEYILFMCYAVLRHYKTEMIENHQHWSFDDILKFCVDLSQKLSSNQTLKDTETVYQMYIRTMSKRSTPPQS